MFQDRRLATFAVAATAGLVGTGLQLPSAHANPAAPVSHTCTFLAAHETLRIRVGAFLSSNGRNIESAQMRATDNDETGHFRNSRVRIKLVRLVIVDRHGRTKLNNTVSPSSPGSFDVGSAGTDAGKLTVTVRWRTHRSSVTGSCTETFG